MSKFFTCAEVAERYRVEVITVWAWIRNKKLTAVKMGKQYLMTEDDLRAFEQSKRKEPL